MEDLEIELPWELVKDLALSLQQLGWLLWCGFNPWPGNFHLPHAIGMAKKKKKERRKRFKNNSQLDLANHGNPMLLPTDWFRASHEDLMGLLTLKEITPPQKKITQVTKKNTTYLILPDSSNY